MADKIVTVSVQLAADGTALRRLAYAARRGDDPAVRDGLRAAMLRALHEGLSEQCPDLPLSAVDEMLTPVMFEQLLDHIDMQAMLDEPQGTA